MNFLQRIQKKVSSFHPKRQRRLLMSFGIFSVLFLFVGIVMVWSFTSELEESVPGVGEMVPAGHLRRVMSPINGQIISFQVKEGQSVKKGDILIELDPDYATVEKAGASEQVQYIEEQLMVLEAALNNQSVSGLSSSHFGHTQWAWLQSAQETMRSRLASARMEIDKSEHLHNESQARLTQANTLFQSTKAMFEKYERLYEKGGLPKTEFEQYRQQLLEREGNVAALEEEVQARQYDRLQAQSQPTTIRGEYHQLLLDKMTELQRQLSTQQSELDKVDLSIAYQHIKAPIDGFVHGLEVNGEGEYVNTGTPLLSIVPENAELVAEVKVSNMDLSYLFIDQEALLQIDAFPYQQFGKLQGHIKSISPSTILDPQTGFPFYLVRIEPDRTIMKKEGKDFPLRSGMTVNAQLITRHKNIISFFTEPIQKQLDKAFRDPSKY